MSIARPIFRPVCQPLVRRPGAAATTPPTDVFLLAGQSNMVGRAVFDGGAGYPEGVLQYTMAGALVAAAPPLDHHDETAGRMGLALQFAIDFAAAYPARRLVLLPAADGGTGFSTGHWGVGEPLYASLVARANTLFAANPDFRLKGILWHQGESDTGIAASYAAELDAMIAGLRGEIAAASASTPFILGQLVPGFTGGAAIQAIIDATPGRVAHTAVVSNAGTGDIGDGLHFNAASLRLLGSRYLAALPAAQANAAAAPGVVADLAATAGDGQVALTWSAPAANGAAITDYRIERAIGGGNWATLADGVSAATGHVDAGLANGTAHAYRVAAVNGAGQGAFSAPVQATPVAPGGQPVSVVATGFAANTADLGSYSFPDIDVGAGGTVVVAAVSRRNASAKGAASISIGGQAATLFARNDASGNYIRFGYLDGVAAGSVDIEVTMEAVQSRAGIHVWVLQNADPGAAVAANATGLSASTDVVKDGIVLGVAISVTPSTPNIDWTGLDERREWTDYGDTFGSGAADRLFGAAAAGHAVSFASNGSLPSLSLLAIPPAG